MSIPDQHDTANQPRHDTAHRALSFAQERLWFLEQLEPDTPVHNVPYALRLKGLLQSDLLLDALNSLIVRHEVLRSVFVASDGQLLQSVLPPRPINWAVEDLSQVPEEARSQRLHEFLTIEARRPFNLTSDLMLRARLVHLAPDDHALLIVLHHIATDGWSTQVILKELAEIYNAGLRESAAELPVLSMQYADYAQWQRERLLGDTLDRDLTYWQSKLESALDSLNLPTDRVRPIDPDYAGERITSSISITVLQSLKALAREEKATLFMVLVALLMLLLHRYSDQEDISIGAPIAGRMHPDSENIVGFFVNMLVLRERVLNEDSLRDLIQRVRNTCLDAYDHQELPFEKLVALLQTQRIRNRTPFFQCSLSFQPPPRDPVQFEGLTLTPIPVYTQTSKFDLDVWIRESQEGLTVQLTYPTCLFERETMDRLMTQFRFLCQQAVEHADTPVAHIPLAPKDEALAALDKLNGRAMEISHTGTIQEEFRAIASRVPEAIAVRHGQRILTYQELDEQSDRLATVLRARGTRPGDVVAIHLGRCPEMIVSLLGILKADACYVPLDPSQPIDWLEQIVEDADPRYILSLRSVSFASRTHESRVLHLNELQEALGSVPISAPSEDTTEANLLAYIMFTSGSTGRPKGVKIPHRGVLRLVKGANYVQLGPETRLLQLASPSFDAATFEIWGPLLNGGECILPTDSLPTVSELGNLLHEYDVNTLWLTSTWFNAIIDEDPSILNSVQQLLIGGEALSVSHVRKALKLLPQTSLINGYGPTENSTFTCCYHIPRTLDPRAASVPIGRPIYGTEVFILDSQLQPTAPGVPGEVCVGGDGLALGYLADDALTATRFIPNPLHPESRRIVYRTGDRVRLLPSGNLAFLGRMDRQMKIRGFRIEPGEIEHVLTQHPFVRDAHVVLRRPTSGGPLQLVAYVLPADGESRIAEILKAYLLAKLPDYMLPSHVIPIVRFPRTSTGKIDEGALPDPAGLRPKESMSPVLPKTETEQQLAEIWTRLLGIEPIGIRSNFFELGGHSLLAVRMVAQLEAAFGISLPLGVLFDAPTIETLSARIEQLGSGPSRSTVLALRPEGTAQPFFCVPPAGSSVYHFSELVQRISPTIPFYGIHPLGLEPLEASQTTVEVMAERYVADLLAVQPNGPYYIGGRCFGAFVAFEMAQQLAAQGQDIALLVLMDPSAPPGVSRDANYYAKRIGYFRRRGQLLPAVIRHLRVRLIVIHRLWIRGLLANAPARRLARAQRVHRRAQDMYRPKPYPGDLTFLGAQEDYHPEDSHALWKDLTTGQFRLHLVPGDHRSITEEPQLTRFAQELEQLILAAQQDRKRNSEPEGT